MCNIMRTIKNIYISGLGAVGCAYASKLMDMDPTSVSVIADSERIERYRRDGVTINGRPYSFNYIRPEDDAPCADLIIVAVKQHHLVQAIKDMVRFVGNDTIILSLLNGISSEQVLGATFGMDKLLYAMCIGIDAVREKTDVVFSSSGRIFFGEKKDSMSSSKVLAVKELFDRASIAYEIPDNMMRSLWWKYMINVGINQTSAVLRAPYGVFQRSQDAEELMKMACREVVAIAKKLDIGLSDADVDEFVRILRGLSPDGKTSMLQDVEAGRKTEVEIFSGTIIELGEKYGVETPVNKVLYFMLKTIEGM